MCLEIMLFLHDGCTQTVETFLFYIVNITGADVLAKQGARTSAYIILAKLNRVNSVTAC